ncbi:NUDIX hydrolase [Nonomuraea rhodomycinica]|uniref:NUDIX domain-containing protein n=1 Tax=Nonomuraea rhodomycinica TaxID=1712872 RepID=A0A7Y6II47_9ACTN|nr:NUDIX domain-containing protein [Nonomuraea rhodomycinica]NUW38684.1 NUDIX domain-containing protein [Nonomuraea rhodomycinica]
MEENIAWSGDNSFKLRAAAIVQGRGRILLCAVDDLDGWFLPGGKVRFGESSTTALARELVEEIGVECAIGRLSLVAESIRSEGAAIHQEVCFYYEASWPDGIPLEVVHGNAEEHHKFAWVSPDELPFMNFLPKEILAHVDDGGGEVRHLFFDRRSTA